VQKSIYLINPAESGPAFHGAEVLMAWGLPRITTMADLSTTTVAALVPPDWSVSICDERVEDVDIDHPASFIGITGKVSQFPRMVELAREFRQRGKTVIIGGPFASLNSDDVRPHADVLVVGEFEGIAAQVFADLSAGTQQSHYEGGRPDLKSSPIPRCDLYPKGRALVAQVQTSRGCPFECEFCDVIQYLGRKQRWKDPQQVIGEVQTLYARGIRTVYFADDNFTVVRRRARDLLRQLTDWNAQHGVRRMLFSTQVSIDLARDKEMLSLCAAAGLRTVFVGVETPNEESLAETLKRQNLRIELAEEVKKIVRAGIMVTCGIIVGFDHDGPDIFQRQANFINTLPIPVISFSLLMAPRATPLFARMAAEGRLVEWQRWGEGGGFLETNIRPLLMSEAELKGGASWLLNRIFEPGAFGERVRHFVEICGEHEAQPHRSIDPFLAKRLSDLGPAENDLVQLLIGLGRTRPDLLPQLAHILFSYCQIRYVLSYYGVWDPELAKRELPAAA
jgi:radical SAM superfamily enzyme YgiQ (UPF0313 family)